MSVIDRFELLYSNFDKQALNILNDVYSPNILFVDPVSEHRGLNAVHEYFANLVNNTKHCECTIINKLTTNENVVVMWKMQFSHPSIKSGALVEVDGISHLTIKDDRVTYHRDFYDMGQMIYEHLPLLGSVVKTIKKRMSA